MSSNVRVRFAPSPTGNIHIGNMRTAILNWLCAKHYDGKFILRIEDTDAERSTAESEVGIIQQLSWMGLDWDEGPVKGGNYGPYRQSERTHLYQEYVEKLLNDNKAYHCYCSKEQLEADNALAVKEKRPPGYVGRCRNLSEQEKNDFRSEGRKSVIRFKVPEGYTFMKDAIQGDIDFDNKNFADFVIQREDGSSPYNFAVVVDDSLMEITHVIRGNDHVSNTPKQIMLFQAFGFDVPQFAHIPMITGQDGVRLSKRHGHTSVSEFMEAGYLPQALMNFLSLLSWSSETGDEILPAERLIKEFDLNRMSKSPAAFDPVKLNWMNGMYIRSISPEERAELAKPYMEKAGLVENDASRFSKIIEAVKDNVETISEFPQYAEVFFKDELVISGDEENELVSRESSQKVFAALHKFLKEQSSLTNEEFKGVMKNVQSETGVKGKDLWMPVRVALTGQMHGPELPLILEVFGLEKCINLVGAVVKK